MDSFDGSYRWVLPWWGNGDQALCFDPDDVAVIAPVVERTVQVKLNGAHSFVVTIADSDIIVLDTIK